MATKRLQTCLLCVLLVSAVHSGMACGHHGRVAHDTHQMASLHLQHKELIQKLAEVHAVRSGEEVDGTSQLQSLRRFMQEATAPQAPLLDTLQQVLQASSLMADSSTRVGGQGAGQQVPAPVRVHIEYQDEGPLNSPAHATLVSVTSTVVRVLQTYLSVRAPQTGPLLVSPMCSQPSDDLSSCLSYYPSFTGPASNASAMCGLQARINPAHILDTRSCEVSGSSSCRSMAGTASGVATDMYLYITSVQTLECERAVAWAQPCMFDLVTNRPVMGSANVCPFHLTSKDPDTLVAIITHEILHALGFTNSMFGSFIDPNTNQRLPSSSVTSTAVVGGNEVTRVITPTVVREARAQFGCDSLEGAQLEDEGGPGSINAHWEYTHYQGDIMMASTTFSAAGEPPRLSRLTLALMEDTGWYVANWTAAGGPLLWGQGTGCTLPQQGCQQFADTVSPTTNQNMFCDVAATKAQMSHLRQLASPSHRSLGYCKGADVLQFTNGCGMILAKDGGLPSCSIESLQFANPDKFGWYNGAASRAYPITYMFEVALNDDRGSVMFFPATGQAGDRDAACYPSTCQNGQVFINVNGQQIRCPTGAYLSLPAWLPGIFLSGIIGPCPDEAQVCRTLGCGPKACHPQGGTCYDGKCMCRMGWSGPSCAFSMVRNETMPFLLDPSMTPGTSTGNGGGAAAPPSMINVTNWVKQVSVTLQLAGITQQAFVGNSTAFQAALATWGNLDVSQTQVANVTLVAVTDGSASVASQAVQQQQAQGLVPSELEGQAQVEQALTSGVRQTMVATGSVENRRRLLSGHALRESQEGVGAKVGWWLRATGTLRNMGRALREAAMRGRSLEVLVTPTYVQVTVNIRPSSTLQTTLLMNRLSNDDQLTLLAMQMQAAGFAVVPGSIKATMRIVQETISVPANSPAADDAINKSKDAANRSADKSKQMTWHTVITAVAVGAGCMVIMTCVLGVACARSRAVHAEVAKEQQQQNHPVSQALSHQHPTRAQHTRQQQNSRPGSPLVSTSQAGIWFPPQLQQPQGAKIAPEWSFGGGSQLPPWPEGQTPVAMGWPPHAHVPPGTMITAAGLAPHLMDINPVYSSPMRRGG